MICWAMTRVPIGGWSEQDVGCWMLDFLPPKTLCENERFFRWQYRRRLRGQLRQPPLPGTVGSGFNDLTRLLIQLLE